MGEANDQIQKWLMFVIDCRIDMAPHWPAIFSNYINKIVRHSCSKWRQPGANNAKVEFGFILYNVQSHDAEIGILRSHWTRNEEDLLESLSSLRFESRHHSTSTCFFTQALSEALLMFPKGPIGNGRKERHCVVVGACKPSPLSVQLHLPNNLLLPQYDHHSAFYHYAQVAHFYPPLDVSLSVISPSPFPAWTEIFQRGNEYMGSRSGGCIINGDDDFTVLISERFREARDALIPQKTLESSSSSHTPIPTDSHHQHFLPPTFLSDEETNLLIWEACCSTQQNTNAQNNTAETAIDEINQQHALLEQEQTGLITSNLGEINEAFAGQLNNPVTQIFRGAAITADDDREWLVSQNEDGVVEPHASSLLPSSVDPDVDDVNSLPGFDDMDADFFWSIMNEPTSNPQNNKAEIILAAEPLNSMDINNQQHMEQETAATSAINYNSENPWLLQYKTNEQSTSQQLHDPNVQISPEAAELQINTEGGWSMSPSTYSLLLSLDSQLQQDSLILPTTFDGSGQPMDAPPLALQLGDHDEEIVDALPNIAPPIDQVVQGFCSRATNNHNNNHNINDSSCNNYDNSNGGEGEGEGDEGGNSNSNSKKAKKKKGKDIQSLGIRRIKMRETVRSKYGGYCHCAASRTTRGPIIHWPQLPPYPLQDLPNIVLTWEGAITTVDRRGKLRLLCKAKAYRRITARRTLTASWPLWLQINGGIAQSDLVSNTSPVDDLIFEMTMRNTNNKFFRILLNNKYPRFDLPSQTLIITPTSESHRFHGTLFQRELSQVPPDQSSSERPSKTCRRQ